MLFIVISLSVVTKTYSTPYGEFGLTFFKAATGAKGVSLDWTVSKQRDCEGYIIERTVDGIEFDSIGFQPSHGDSDLPSHYQFTDTNPLSVLSYYRLGRVDIDGWIEYSELVVVLAPKSRGLLDVMPHSTTGRNLNLCADGHLNETVNLTLMSLQGTTIWQKTIKIADDRFRMPLSIDPLPEDGVYIFRIVNSHEVNTTRIIIEN